MKFSYRMVAVSPPWVSQSLAFLSQMQTQRSSVENRKFIAEFSEIIRAASQEDLSLYFMNQGGVSTMALTPTSQEARSSMSLVETKTDDTASYMALKGSEEFRTLFQGVLRFLKEEDDAPVLALSSLKNRVSAQCLIGGVEIPLTTYAPANAPGLKLEGTLYLHPDTFALDRQLLSVLDRRIYLLLEATALKYKAKFVAKGWLPETASHRDVEALNEKIFNEKILNGSNGFLTGLVLRTPSLKDLDTALFYSLYLLTFFLLDDTTESFDLTQKAESFSKKAMDILSGKVDVDVLHREEGLQHPGYYLAGQLRVQALDLLSLDVAALDDRLANWYGLMADQFDSAVEEVKSKGNLDKLLPSYSTHESEREATIGTRPCLEMVDILLGVNWSRHMRRKLDLIEKQVAKAVFEFNNVVSLYKELKEAFVDSGFLSMADFYATFNAQTMVHKLDESTLLKLPLNGVLIRSYHSRISLVAAMSEGIGVYDHTIHELEESIDRACRETSSPKEIEALQARFSLTVGSTRWSMKTGYYTRDKKAVSDDWWRALNKDLFTEEKL